MVMTERQRDPESDAHHAITKLVPASPRSTLIVRLLGWLVASVLRLQCATWRIKTAGLEQLDRRLTAGERIMAIFWHGKYFPLFPLLRGRQALIFTSDSFRGRIIAEICRRFDYACAAIPVEDKGWNALEFVRERADAHQVVAFAVDGPLGPYHVVKPGAIVLAARLGFAVIPVSTACRRKLVLTRRWDRRELPGLFTRVGVAVGGPQHPSTPLEHKDITLWQERLKAALETADQRAQKLIAN